MRNILAAMVSVTLMAGCATNIGEIERSEDKATIVAYSDSVLSASVPLGTMASTKIVKVNGTKVGSPFNSIKTVTVEPGTHTLTISCHVIYGGLNEQSTTDHTLTFETGKIYVFKARLDEWRGCKSSYEVI